MTDRHYIANCYFQLLHIPCIHLDVIYDNNKCYVWLEVIENDNLTVSDLLLCKGTMNMIWYMWNIM